MNNRPIVLFAACWVSGSAVAAALPFRGVLLIAAAATLLAVAAVAGKGASWRLAAVCLLALLLAAGQRMWADAANVTSLPALQAAAETDGPRAKYPAEALGTIVSAVDVDGDRVTFHMEADAIHVEGHKPLADSAERLMVQLRLAAQPEQAIAAAWQRGDRIAVAGELAQPATASNSGGFDYRRYLRSQRIHWLLQAKGAAAVTVRPAASPTAAAALLGRVDAARAWLGARVEELYPGPQAGYMKGLLLGLREDIDPGRFQQYAQLGLTHILAISGLHVGVFMYVLGSLLKLLRLRRERIMTVLMASVPLYVLMAGAAPSVMRAGVMAVLGLAAARMGKLKDGLHLLSAAAVGLLLLDPYYLDSVSFQMSFIVTLGLIAGVPAVRGMMPARRRGGPLFDLLSVSIVAQIVSFPLTIYYFNQFHLLSLPANVVVVPIVSMIVLPLGTASMIVMPIWGTGAGWIAQLCRLVNECTYWIVEQLAEQSGLRLIWGSPPAWWIAAWLLLAGTGFRLMTSLRHSRNSHAAARQLTLQQTAPLDNGSMQAYEWESGSVRRARTYRFAVGTVLAAAVMLLGYAYMPDKLDTQAKISFLDVGQGDAALIRTPSGKHILIDGGGTVSFRKPGEEWRERRDPFEVGAKVVVPLLMKRGVKQIDLLVISHLDSDHIGGLRAVADVIPIKRAWWNGTVKQASDAMELLQDLLDNDVPLQAPALGDTLQLDAHTELLVLGQGEERNDTIPLVQDQNEASLVVAVSLYGRTFLFAGDINSATEGLIIRNAIELSGRKGNEPSRIGIDVLKLAHHGSRYSTSDEWLAYWRPNAVVVSVGAYNTYGHPHPHVLDRVKASGAELWRTDDGGEVSFALTREGILVNRRP
ncbi:DNA internalization-related competence protein ComEC/Rec2 [Paenibacillus sp. J5C_2022]|uniref:DNA internalization-related competence protein ComEC/Rec2 n=1 Tax=Paenibacillus sp. J5C2022 TaxID=2977129 RepID=UPI0021D0A270|nr:DNA internalization-related competence protein ComEC/Rec2 [Paenibacillus sp. J5C2022]MCU6707639.1 DNA internalization-related competence protein ComEC/Rec2 [Paenibacillus sp. J5C2022]